MDTKNALALAVEIIARWEGYRGEAYRCPAGIWTLGYGETQINGRPVRRGDVMSEGYAHQRLIDRVRTDYMPGVIRAAGSDLTAPQLAALTSLAYNVGVTAVAHSSAARHARAGRHDLVPASIRAWNKARVNGQLTVLKGLVNRRADEVKLYTRAA